MFMNLKKFLFVFIFFVSFTTEAAFAWEYIARAEAVKNVKIRSEVSAKINKIYFNEGTFIDKSATLFTLNSAQFQAEVSLKKAELEHAQAQLDGAIKYLSRLKATDKRGVTASDLDTAESEVRQYRAAVEEAKAALKISQIQLNNTRIIAPFAGRVGKANFNQGSYISPDDVLCEIVQIDPIRILFAMPDRDYMSVKKSQGKLKYELILADGSIFPGTIEKDFEDNVMNSETGSINIWLKVSNENNILLPGALVRVRVINQDVL